jgi:hypothetical protein
MLARQTRTNFLATLTNVLAAGKPLPRRPLPPASTHHPARFSAASRNLPDWDRRVNFDQAKMLAAILQPGKPSDLVTTADGALVLFLKNREPVTEAELKAALPNYLAELRKERQFEGFSDWFQHQIEATAIDMPSGDDAGG